MKMITNIFTFITLSEHAFSYAEQVIQKINILLHDSTTQFEHVTASKNHITDMFLFKL